jgi:hypothetical protein
MTTHGFRGAASSWPKIDQLRHTVVRVGDGRNPSS